MLSHLWDQHSDALSASVTCGATPAVRALLILRGAGILPGGPLQPLQPGLLPLAVRCGSVETAEALLEYGEPVEGAAGGEEDSILFTAVQRQQVKPAYP